MRRHISAALLAIAVAALLVVPSAAPAAQTGNVTLFTSTNFTGPAISFNYTSCFTAQQAPIRFAGSFRNSPLTGCRAVLLRGFQRFELCAGLGVIPEAFRAGPTLRIEPGASRPCVFA